MTGAELLSIKRPEKLFEEDLTAIKKKYYELAKEWHPDTNKSKDAERVFQHVSVLHEQALKKYEEGSWGGTGLLLLSDSAGMTLREPYLSKHSFELGEYYVMPSKAVYVLSPGHDSFLHNAVRTIDKGFKFGSDQMKSEVVRYLPVRYDVFKTSDGRPAFQVFKDRELLSLRDILTHFGGKLDPKHAAWIGSAFHNICCYLNYTGLTHNAISVDTCFINPADHSVALLGGWWYATKTGERLRQVPATTLPYLPWEVKMKKFAGIITDLELTRALVRELLGDRTGVKLKEPKQMVNFLKGIASGDPVAEYEEWRTVLEKTFGKRRFTVMDLNAEKLYNN